MHSGRCRLERVTSTESQIKVSNRWKRYRHNNRLFSRAHFGTGLVTYFLIIIAQTRCMHRLESSLFCWRLKVVYRHLTISKVIWRLQLGIWLLQLTTLSQGHVIYYDCYVWYGTVGKHWWHLRSEIRHPYVNSGTCWINHSPHSGVSALGISYDYWIEFLTMDLFYVYIKFIFSTGLFLASQVKNYWTCSILF